MNRKAKRNKYKKLITAEKIKTEALEKELRLLKNIKAYEAAYNKAEVITISVLYEPIEYDLWRLSHSQGAKENYRHEVAKMLAEELLKSNCLKLTDTGYGFKYDLDIVKR